MKNICLIVSVFFLGLVTQSVNAQKISNIQSLSGEKDMTVQFTPLKNDSCLDCQLYGKISYSLRGQERDSFVCFDAYMEDFYEIFEGEIIGIKGSFNNVVCDDGSMYNYFGAHDVKPFKEMTRNLIRPKIETIDANGDMQNEITGSLVTIEYAQEALDFHNKARAEVGSPPLVWSSELALHAQDWAYHLANDKNCSLSHRPKDGSNWGSKFGENIYWATGPSGINDALAASKSWYEEKESYVYQTLDENNWQGTGHYTQMVWKSTTEVGMGVSYCSNGAKIVVANYNPPGNYMGEKPY